MLEIKQKLIIDGREYSGYKIKQSILDLETDLIGMVVLYFGPESTVDFIKTHWFKSFENNNINELIDKTHNIHTKWLKISIED